MAQNFHSISPLTKWFSNPKASLFISLLAFAIILIVLLAHKNYINQTEIDTNPEHVFLLDVSNSMNAKDMEGDSRLNAAKHTIFNMLHGHLDNVSDTSILDGRNSALVIFSGQAQCIVPLCNDLTYFLQMLQSAHGGMLGDQSTNLQNAIQAGVAAFGKANNEKRKCRKKLILLTDGENHYGDLSNISNLLSKENINLFVIGFGTETGATCETGTKPPQHVTTKINKAVLKLLQEASPPQAGLAYPCFCPLNTPQKYFDDIMQEKSYIAATDCTYFDFTQTVLLLIGTILMSLKCRRL